MMRTVLIAFVFICLSANSQSINVLIGQPEHNVLYDGYPNLIKLGWWSKVSSVDYVGEGMEVKKSDQPGYYECTPRGSKRTKLFAIHSKTKDTVAKQEFRIIPLPTPTIFLGTAREGEKLTGALNLLSVKFDESVSLTGTFSVSEWELSFQGRDQLYTGQGNQLTTETMQALKEAPDGCVVNLAVLYSGTGIPRKFTRVKFTK